MTDTLVDTPVDDSRKPLGRNQLVAIWAYAVPYASVVLPSFASVVVCLWRADVPCAMQAIDKIADFSTVYGLVAVGSILVVSGAIKGIQAVAGALGSKSQG